MDDKVLSWGMILYSTSDIDNLVQVDMFTSWFEVLYLSFNIIKKECSKPMTPCNCKLWIHNSPLDNVMTICGKQLIFESCVEYHTST